MNNTKTVLMKILVLTIGVLSAPAWAQDAGITLQAQVSRQRAYVGDSMNFQIVLRGADATTLPSIEFPDSLNGVYRNSGRQSFSSTHIINGRQQRTVNNSITFKYSITILEPGDITIPAASIQIDGREYRSNPVNITSVMPKLASEDRVEAIMPRRTLYLNESVPLDITWWIGNINTSEFTFESSLFPESIELTPVETGFHGSQSFALTIAGQQVIGVLDQPKIKGVPKARMRLRVMIAPTEIGTLSVGPIRVVFNRAEPNKAPYRAYAESEPIKLDVIALPEDGKPEGYRGAIGNYKLLSSASNRSVNVGDPIELVVRIAGNEPMPGIADGPTIDEDQAFTESFKVASEGWREDLPRNPGVRTYRTTIRATESSVREIPAIKLPSFDTESGQYQIFASNSIPIDVRAVKEVTIADAIGTVQPQPSKAPAPQTDILSSDSGTWAHAPIESMLAKDGFDFYERIRSPAWIGTIATGPALAIVAIGAVRRKSHAESCNAKVNKAWSAAKKLHANGQVALSIRTYLGAIIGCEPDAFTANDIDQLNLEHDLEFQAKSVLLADEKNELIGTDQITLTVDTNELLVELRRSVQTRRAS